MTSHRVVTHGPDARLRPIRDGNGVPYCPDCRDREEREALLTAAGLVGQAVQEDVAPPQALQTGR